MRSLLIETSTERGVIAIVENGVCLHLSGLPFGYQNSRFLVPQIDEALQAHPEPIELIVVGVGPGSYTGTRSSVAVAKSLSFSSKIPLVGVNTMEGFVPDKEGPFAVIFDAKLSGATLLKGVKSENKVEFFGKPEVVPLEKLKEKLSDVALIVSPNASRLQLKLDGSWEWEETAPDPIQMTRLGEEKFKRGEYTTDGSWDIDYMGLNF